MRVPHKRMAEVTRTGRPPFFGDHGDRRPLVPLSQPCPQTHTAILRAQTGIHRAVRHGGQTVLSFAGRLTRSQFADPPPHSPPRSRVLQQLKAVAPGPEQAGIVALQNRTGQAIVAQVVQRVDRGAEQRRANAVALGDGVDEDPGQVRHAEASLDSVRWRRFRPLARVPVRQVAVRPKRDQDGSDRLLVIGRDRTRLYDDGIADSAIVDTRRPAA
jgi:hypothetical protein